MVLFTDPTRASLDKADENGTYPCFGSAGVPGSVLYAWAPGAAPLDLLSRQGDSRSTWHPLRDADALLAAGWCQSLIDQTKLRFRLAPEPPKYEVFMQLMGNFDFNFSPALGIQPAVDDPEDVKFEIPPDTAMHREVMRWTYTGRLPGSGKVAGHSTGQTRGRCSFSIAPHMHYTGVDMKIWIDRPEPGWDRLRFRHAHQCGILCGLQAQCPQNTRFYQLWN